MSDQEERSRFRVVRHIATGGMAEVFQAESESLAGFRKTVAIKRVLPHLARNEKFLRMFLDEARLSARLNHPNIVHVFDIGQADDAYFLVMEYVDGVDLKAANRLLRSHHEKLPLPVAVYLGIEVANGLHYAHQLADEKGAPLGIVHRDVSPANILLTRNGGVRIVDFGLAKAASQLEKTDPGVIKGKFGYLAPETAAGEEADFHADIFALGTVLWEMLAGRRLFQGASDWDTVQAIRGAVVPSLTAIDPAIPEELDAVIRTALAKDKAQRYGSAGAFARALTDILFAYGEPVTAEDLGTLVQRVVGSPEQLQSGTPDQGVVSPRLQQQLLRFATLGSGPRKLPTLRPTRPSELPPELAQKLETPKVPDAAAVQLEVPKLPADEPETAAEPEPLVAQASAPQADAEPEAPPDEPPPQKRSNPALWLVLSAVGAIALGSALAWWKVHEETLPAPSSQSRQ